MAARESRLRDLTCLLMIAQAVMMWLQWAGRAAPSLAPRSPGVWPGVWADQWWWVICHGVSIGLLAWGLASRRRVLPGLIGCWLSVASWLVWGVSDLAWSLDTRPPVSLVAPLLALVVCAPLSVITARMWSVRGI
jgi:hypothetical protein